MVKKGTIWVFGDSFSSPLWESPFPLSHTYSEWKGYYPPIYSEILAQERGMNLRGFAKSGADNYTIFHSVISKLGGFKKGDVVIIGWSTVNRFRMVNESSHWVSVHTNLGGDGFPKEVKDSILLNRWDHKEVYGKEVDDWITLLNYSLKGIKVIHWAWDKISTISIPKFYGLQTIREETNGEIDDLHYGEVGHQILSKKIASLWDTII